MIAAALLDFDGTLFDTESVALPSLVEKFNTLYGARLASEGRAPLTLGLFLDKFHGLSRTALCRALTEHFGFEVSEDDLYASREHSVLRYYAKHPGGIRIAPGMSAALVQLKHAGVGLAVVSNNPAVRALAAFRHASSPEEANAALHAIGPNFFEAGALQKPHPDVYLLALEVLGYNPRDCIAVEDSVAGANAARAAGIGRVLGYTGFYDAPDARDRLLAAGCHDTFQHWDDVPGLVLTS